MNYIGTHWRGNQSLIWSFWINLVAVRVFVLVGERFTHPPFTDRSDAAIAATVVYFVVFQLIVYPWQAVGLIRACDRYLSALGSQITVVAVQFGLVLSLLITGMFVAGAWQSLFADPQAMIINQRQKIPPLLGDFTLKLSDDKTRIYQQGDFGIGITRELGELLAQYPDITGVVLSSNGGRVTEGRGLARLIDDKGLNTYVFDICKSACTTAFIGGVSRTLGADGKLGFHQFSLKGKSHSPYIDPVAEQKIDLAFFTAQKIDSGFLEKVFQASPGEIWFPSTDELLAAGVIHKLEERQTK